MELEYESKRPLHIPYAGPILLEFPLLNKGSAFTEEERANFNLHGLLPEAVETIEEQAERAWRQYQEFKHDIEKHVYLRNIQDTNETLFYRLLDGHLSEMMPIIYTPTVGEACEHFSDIYRRARGLFISYPNRAHIDDMLQNATKQNVKVIVVTDGERILGLGDQGIGGMGIPIGKLSLYTACGGISPAYTLPVVLDVGTNNPQRLNDPLYMGWRHPRITDDEYYEFVDEFIQAVKRRWPNVLLQFEDFAQKNATPLLNRYRDEICSFNDDIQGTAAVALGSLIAASRAAGTQLRDQTVAFLGAGSAGCGIAEQIIAQMKSEGLSDEEARARVFMVDRFGLLTDKLPNLLDFQSKLVQKSELLANWDCNSDAISLLEVVRNAKPTILIGVSGQPGLFTEEIIREMHKHCARPIVMPLSNPTSRVEARPEDIIRWTEGAALVATGSPFSPVNYQDKVFPIAQCNNSYIFPGIGLGVLASGAKRITDGMLMAASRALADCSPLANNGEGALLPDLADIQQVSKRIALEVGKAAQLQGAAVVTSSDALQKAIEHNFWQPQYRSYKRTSF
ncbi:NAD-dependent malic enzyme [Pectobacterium aroidearum]|jgi:malate dehydrogenase (oxaloacetate-decarboxylating)|uniref:NAD-dependent malic enzyme n=2 Tax=Pectobacterium TaxID=122277 RepID=MAO1_PECCP|nr:MULTISPECIES: NAD-dependent malic enzyme [Pectobacterium]C6DDS6.1 RecName: Full=NAD-dependent malic enzyme; Short=NAD-ME [Pectobacterium carotovorum subsp. carotovorum PC1]ACT12538.1 Malate dehydrogenase (oxaloacetate-decarboxylating) [Pectobacterium carotovorum subsp. carotovorum PC1]MBA0203666.1 NAD-dependent malic enzyme [Pectobacterium aroidearum]MBA5199929.1 NAD-dependent malic enzyme [Pectobacterium aroidearum]MBA5202534.1 NAD-dependent malic enzyme [Pectobacterium aroidearum]MBA5228